MLRILRKLSKRLLETGRSGETHRSTFEAKEGNLEGRFIDLSLLRRLTGNGEEPIILSDVVGKGKLQGKGS